MTSSEAADSTSHESLEYWLSRATDAYNSKDSQSKAVVSFCERVNLELEGPQVATRLLAHKIHSPHDKEALLALDLMDECVRQCGDRFHTELGKFKFLNELIKLLSPKYLGDQSSSKVKQRITELLYVWSHTLRHLSKICEAYDMLKNQGIIKSDPVYMDGVYEMPVVNAPQSKMASFEDEEKAKLLDSLLRSGNPDDLIVANRLIKSMVKAESDRQEKMSQRDTDLKAASNNARLLWEVMSQTKMTSSNISQRDAELMRELYATLVELRKHIFKYASEVNEVGEDSLAEVLTVNDDVNKVIEQYKNSVEHLLPAVSTKPKTANLQISHTLPVFKIADSAPLVNFDEIQSSGNQSALAAMVDKMLDGSQPGASFSAASSSFQSSKSTAGDLLTGDDDKMLGTAISPTTSQNAALVNLLASKTDPVPKVMRQAQKKPNALDELSENLMQQHLPGSDRRKAKLPLHELASQSHSLPQQENGTSPEILVDTSRPEKNGTAQGKDECVESAKSEDIPLENIELTIEDLELSWCDRPSVCIAETAHVKCTFYYADNRPQSDVICGLVVINSANKKAVKSLKFEMEPDEDEGVPIAYTLEFVIGQKERHLTSGSVQLDFFM